MLPKPKYCSHGGATLKPREHQAAPGEVCPACQARVTRYPPPLAAAVVLNDRREVLLVKCRHAASGAGWCLPAAFAQSDESLANTALRALSEQTGVDADVIRLLDTQATTTDRHGDVLVVTYEMRKVGGAESPGPDTETLAYFPLSRYPNLALPPHDRALRICAESHLEEWAIRDSFEHLQRDDEKAMLSDILVTLIREHATEIARGWIAEAREDPTTASYREIDSGSLLERAVTALSQFGRWLAGREADGEVAEFYFEVGRERRAQGFENQQVLSALTLLKKHVWTFARDHGVWERPIDVYRALELSRRISVFFDKAIYHTTRGFETADVS